MQRVFIAAVVAVLSWGGWTFLQNYTLDGLSQLKVVPRTASSNGQDGTTSVAFHGGVIRVASFNIQVFGQSKLGKPDVMQVLCEVARRVDIMAIQEIRAKSDDILPRFVAQINSTGRKYDYVIGPRLGRSDSKEQYAFVYDTATIDVDRQALYTVSDPGDRLHREPLVGCFRARGAPPNEAFTFSLINIHTDPDETKMELDALADVYSAVRNDGRGEDDIILLGDLNVDENHLGRLGQVPNITWTVSGAPTNTRKDKTYDNILFNRLATSEFTGNCGVLDLMHDFNLSTQQALQVSDHMPIWAEFSVFEGGREGRITTAPGTQLR
ncbi:MAG: endonuclease/exonuclease/phosphatase family protein [Planctomycetota bacterium]|nr:endonuclease/exonuclease/phosphatase family protein [Planctomycetota bacterium]